MMPGDRFALEFRNSEGKKAELADCHQLATGLRIKNIQYTTMARTIYLSKATDWLEMAEKSAYQATVLAKELRVSQRQLRRYTRASFGRSPQNWLNEQRLVQAAEMLKRLRMAKTVAFQLGFKQPSHFSREFKLHYGVSPTRFLAWSDGQADRH